MKPETLIATALSKPGSVVLPGNLPYVQHFEQAGGRAIIQPSGHMVFYGSGGQRFLMTDPEGHPLHECDWGKGMDGRLHLKAARLQLDWGQWVGLRPEGLVNRTVLDLSARPGWQSVTQDDLRMMAARAMHVSLEQIKFFYLDDDVVIDAHSGQATISQRKDAFYVLQDGRFESAQFMSCMSSMRWGEIDYLPVVELFLSLLPGTGNATFELIRGLYDDQNPTDSVPLCYRGIPSYPSEGAFRLFSQFFIPSSRGTEDLLAIFLDSNRSHEVSWLPSPDPPLRYFAPSQKLCVTVKNGMTRKATISDDPSGLSFFAPDTQGVAPFGRRVAIQGHELLLDDGQKQVHVPLKSSWGITPSPSSTSQTFMTTWKSFFPDGLPSVDSREAFSAVLLYPEDDTQIGEKESQPFVFDYLDDLGETGTELLRRNSSAKNIMVYNCDAVLSTCIKLDKPRNHSVLFSSSAFAQKHAQLLWNQLARINSLSWTTHISFWLASQHTQGCLKAQYDVVYWWIPFDDFENSFNLEQAIRSLSDSLIPGGIGLLAGPSFVRHLVQTRSLDMLHAEQGSVLPTFRLHQAILPKAQLHPDLNVFVLQKKCMGN